MRNTLESPLEHLEREFKEHLKAPSPIYDHFNITDHYVTIENFSNSREGRPEPLQMDKRSIVHKG